MYLISCESLVFVHVPCEESQAAVVDGIPERAADRILVPGDLDHDPACTGCGQRKNDMALRYISRLYGYLVILLVPENNEIIHLASCRDCICPWPEIFEDDGSVFACGALRDR